jgi:anti-sigma factor RsiW
MHQSITEQLSDYLDGELTAGEAAAVEAHLRECAACNAVLNDLKRIVAQAQHLEPRPPQADLWADIERRIERVTPPRRVSFTLPQLAAAAALLIAVSAGTAIKFAAPAVPASVPAEQTAKDEPAQAEAAESIATIAVTPVGFSDAQYDAAVADLEKAVKAGRGRLDKSTIEVVEHNLQIIDQAIAQAREALAGDPANSYLSGHLVEARRRKLDLLRRAAALAETD